MVSLEEAQRNKLTSSVYHCTAMYINQDNVLLLLYATSEDPNAKGKGRGGASEGADDIAKRLAEEQARLQREKDEAARRGKGTDGRSDGGDGRGDGADGRDGTDGRGDAADGRGDGADGRGGLGLGDGSGGDATGKYGQGREGTEGSGKSGKGSGMGLGADGLGGQSAGVGSGGDGTGMFMTKMSLFFSISINKLPLSLSQVIIIHSNAFIPDDKVHFASGLSDKNAVRGKPAELVCKLNTDKIDGVWYKDGKKVSLCIGAVHQ